MLDVQVLPHLVHGLLDDDQLTDVVATACQTGMSLYRRNLPPGVTARELRRIDESIVILVSTMQEMFEPDGTVGTPKVHKLSHATGDIRRWGQLKHINADFFEGQHIDIKNVYRWVSVLELCQGTAYSSNCIGHACEVALTCYVLANQGVCVSLEQQQA